MQEQFNQLKVASDLTTFSLAADKNPDLRENFEAIENQWKETVNLCVHTQTEVSLHQKTPILLKWIDQMSKNLQKVMPNDNDARSKLLCQQAESMQRLEAEYNEYCHS